MRILFLGNDFPSPACPGKGVFNFHLLRSLAKQYDVRVICPVPFPEAFRSFLRLGRRPSLPGPPAQFSVEFPNYYYPPGVIRNYHDWFYWQSIRPTVQRMVSQWLPDVILSYWLHPDGAAAISLGRMIGVPVAVIVGGSDVLLLPRRRGIGPRLQKVLRTSDAVIAVCDLLRSRSIQLGTPPERAHVWHQGIDQAFFYLGNQEQARERLKLSPHGPVLVWVGRMHPVKGLDVLLEACDTLRSRALEFQLFLIGGGPLRKVVEGEIRARGLANWVRCVGEVPNDRLGIGIAPPTCPSYPATPKGCLTCFGNRWPVAPRLLPAVLGVSPRLPWSHTPAWFLQGTRRPWGML